MALTKVDAGLQYFPQFAVDRAIASAEIYVGIPGLDPSILANQYQAYIVQEDGTQVAVSQPIRTGPGGVPAYNGSPAQIGVNEASYSLKVLNSLGAQIYYIPDSADMPKTSSDAASIAYTPPGTSVFTTTVQEELNRGYINALRFTGVVADKVTDCYTGLMAAISSAYVLKTALYLPSAPPGFYYRINQGLVIQNKKDFVLFGDGTQSLIVNFNAAGQNAITVDASTHVRIRSIGITGVAGSGNGLEFINSSHKYIVENVWAGWNDGDGSFVVTEAISGRWIGCSVDENNGYDPAGLGSMVRGNSKRAWWVKSQASGLNNDTNLTSCVIDGGGAGGNYSLQVGTPGGDQVESFEYQGLIQASEKLVYFAAARDAHIRGTHIEPPVGALADYVVRIEDSLNCTIEGRNIQGDVLISNSVGCGLKNLRTGGINIESDCDECFVEQVRYGNIVTGPTDGKLIDQSLTSRITDTVNAANERYAIGSNIKWARNRLIGNNMRQIVLSGGSPVVPCGFEKFGSYTGSLVSVSPYGSSAFQVNHTGDFTQGFKVRLAPITQFRGRRVTVDALVFNQLVGGGAYIFMETTGGATPGTNGQESFQIGTTERMQVTFNVPVDATTADLIFTGVNGARVNWVNIDIDAEGFTPITEEDAAGAATATPDVSFNDGSNRGGYPLKVAIVGAGSNITDFLNPHTGVPFTIRFTAGRTVVNSATLKLAGGVNFVATADDLLALEYGLDGVFREVARSVN